MMYRASVGFSSGASTASRLASKLADGLEGLRKVIGVRDSPVMVARRPKYVLDDKSSLNWLASSCDAVGCLRQCGFTEGGVKEEVDAYRRFQTAS